MSFNNLSALREKLLNDFKLKTKIKNIHKRTISTDYIRVKKNEVLIENVKLENKKTIKLSNNHSFNSLKNNFIKFEDNLNKIREKNKNFDLITIKKKVSNKGFINPECYASRENFRVSSAKKIKVENLKFKERLTKRVNSSCYNKDFLNNSYFKSQRYKEILKKVKTISEINEKTINLKFLKFSGKKGV